MERREVVLGRICYNPIRVLDWDIEGSSPCSVECLFYEACTSELVEKNKGGAKMNGESIDGNVVEVAKKALLKMKFPVRWEKEILVNFAQSEDKSIEGLKQIVLAVIETKTRVTNPDALEKRKSEIKEKFLKELENCK